MHCQCPTFLRDLNVLEVNGGLSNIFPLKHGVPQGSCLCPLLFTIDTSKLFAVVEGYLPDVHCYVDDTTIHVTPRLLQQFVVWSSCLSFA